MCGHDVLDSLDELYYTIREVCLHYDYWRLMIDPISRKDYSRPFRAYPLFFGISNHGHFVTMVIGLYRLYETRDDTHNIPTLLKQLRLQKKLPEPMLAQFEKRCSAAKPIWKKVSILRNQAYGHKTWELSGIDVFKKASLDYEKDIPKLIDDSKALINDIRQFLRGETYFYDVVDMSSETKELLAVLQKDLVGR